MTHDDGIPSSLRPVRLPAAGGTIAMRGDRAVPALDGGELVEQLPQLKSGPALRSGARPRGHRGRPGPLGRRLIESPGTGARDAG